MKVIVTVIKSPATRKFALGVGRIAATAVAEHLVAAARTHLDNTRGPA